MLILNKSSIKFLNNELKLPAKGDEQDWDLELADANRLKDFLLLYNDRRLSDDDKIALMSLILASYDERLQTGENCKEINDQLSHIFQQDYSLMEDLLKYWGLMDENDSNDHYALTPVIKEIYDKIRSR